VTRTVPAARQVLRRLVLVIALLAGALCVLGTVTLDLARGAAAASARAVGPAGPAGGDRAPAPDPTASNRRGVAESGPHTVRVLLRAAVATAGAAAVGEQESGTTTAAPVVPSPQRIGAVVRLPAAHHGSSAASVRDRSPPVPAGT
jgi:hypothetical protein